ncbi:PA3496 family putative envelope integrity protein [Pseudomonas aeruginosa]
MDSKTRRKLEDQRRKQFRRAIEDHCEQLRRRQERADYPEREAAAYLSAKRQGRRSAQRGG